MTYHCPYCGTLFDMGSDHGIEPCVPCYRAGRRIDSCGNKYTITDGPHRINSTASPYDLNGMQEYPGE